jgi:hypothetical protein
MPRVRGKCAWQVTGATGAAGWGKVSQSWCMRPRNENAGRHCFGEFNWDVGCFVLGPWSFVQNCGLTWQ